jgi:hypothetical protein
MRCFKLVTYVVLMLAIDLPVVALAQTGNKSAGNPPSTRQMSTPPATPSTGTANNNGNGNGTTAAPRREPCWKVAGISPQVLQQRRSIEQNAKSQIAALCSDSSLSAQQRRQKIHEIHQQTQQSLQGLITPQQEEALKACRASRGGTEAPQANMSGTGPCGNTATPAPEPPASSHKFN